MTDASQEGDPDLVRIAPFKELKSAWIRCDGCWYRVLAADPRRGVESGEFLAVRCSASGG